MLLAASEGLISAALSTFVVGAVSCYPSYGYSVTTLASFVFRLFLGLTYGEIVKCYTDYLFISNFE